MVGVGLTAAQVTKTEPSTTKMLSASWACPHRSTTDDSRVFAHPRGAHQVPTGTFQKGSGEYSYCACFMQRGFGVADRVVELFSRVVELSV